MKVQISLDDELMKRLDEHADSNYMSRSGLISVAVTKYLNEQAVIFAVKDMSVAMKKIADTGSLDDEVIKQLEHFQIISDLLVSNL